MKNLNDELKKLNVEYDVSNSFKDKVMEKIKENTKNEALDSFYITITKVAYAAAIIVICAIFVRNSNNITKDNASNLVESEKIDDSSFVLSHDTVENAAASESFNTSIMEYDRATKKEAYDTDGNLGSFDIETILKKNNITILEIENDYILVESEKEKIESLLEDFDCQIEIIDDGKIKISWNI